MINLGNEGIAVNVTARDNGRWFDSPWPGVRFLIAYMDTDRFAAARHEKLKQLNQVALEDLDARGQKDVVNYALSRAVFLGWEGLVDENDTPVPYSADVAYAILGDERYTQIRDFVMLRSMRLKSFLEERKEADLKN